MATAFVQELFGGSSKTAGTSIAITGSKTVTVGNTIFLAYAGDDVGSAFGVTDNLGNTYSLVKEQINTGNVKTQLWRAPVTTGGTLTTQTVSWTTNVTAKAACSAEFSDVGTLRLTDGNNSAFNVCDPILSQAFFTGELWIGACGDEDDVGFTFTGSTGTPSQTKLSASGTAGYFTTGGGSASNIGVGLMYLIANADSTANAVLRATTSDSSNQDTAGAGAIYNAPAAGGPAKHMQPAAMSMDGVGARY